MNIYWESGLIQSIWNYVQSAKDRYTLDGGGAQQKIPSHKGKQQI